MNPFENVKTLLLLILLTLAVFLGIGAYLYFVTTPEAFLRAMMRKMSNVETVHYVFQEESIGNVVRPGTVIQGLGFSRMVHQIQGKLKGKISGDIDLRNTNFSYTADVGLSAWDERRENLYKIDFEQIVDETGVHIRVNQAPESDQIDLSPFVGQWAKTNQDFFSQFIASPNLNEQQLRDLRNLVSETEFFNFQQKVGYNFIGFTLVRGFKVKLDKENTFEFIKNFKLLSEGRSLTRSEYRHLDDFLSEAEEMDIELWIGWNNKYLYRLQIEGEYSEANGTRIRFVVIIDLSQFNDDINIEAPEKAKSAQDILRGAGGLPTAGEAVLGGEEAPMAEPSELPVSAGTEVQADEVGFRDSDGDGLYDTFEYSLGTDINNPDTDGDGVSDGDEVKEGTNPLGTGMLFDYR